MSAFGNNEKDNLYSEMLEFLENHKPSELLDIVQYALQCKEESD